MQDMFFGFVAAWWPLRHEPNVLLLHQLYEGGPLSV
jgi:hypothetical protein